MTEIVSAPAARLRRKAMHSFAQAAADRAADGYTLEPSEHGAIIDTTHWRAIEKLISSWPSLDEVTTFAPLIVERSPHDVRVGRGFNSRTIVIVVVHAERWSLAFRPESPGPAPMLFATDARPGELWAVYLDGETDRFAAMQAQILRSVDEPNGH